jgi:hypothetical protein
MKTTKTNFPVCNGNHDNTVCGAAHATTETTTREITTCGDCAAGISNDDWTHLDMYEGSDEAMASIAGTLELLGWLTYLGPSTFTGSISCPICGDDAMASATFTTTK